MSRIITILPSASSRSLLNFQRLPSQNTVWRRSSSIYIMSGNSGRPTGWRSHGRERGADFLRGMPVMAAHLHNQEEKSGWGRMRYNFPPEASYHVFILQYIAWNQHKCRDYECRQYMLTDSVFLASEPFLNSELNSELFAS